MASTRDLTVRINGDASGFKKAVGEVKKSSKGAEQGSSKLSGALHGVAVVGKLAAAATVAAGAAIGGLGVLAIKGAGEYEQSRVAFETMLGSAEKARTMLGEIAEFAKSTPFELPEVVKGSKQLLAFGIEQEKIIPTMRKLGDIAAGVGVPVGQLTNVFGQVKVAGRLMGQDLLQFTNAGVPLIAALADTMKKPQEEIKDLVSQGKVGFPEVEKAIESLTNNGGKFGGMMEKQSKTFSGVVSNIKDGFGEILRGAVGITKTGDIIEGGIFDRVKKGAEKLMPVVQQLGEQIGPFMVQAFATGGEVLKTVVEAFKTLYNIIAPILGPSLQALWNTIQTQLMPALQRLWAIIAPQIIPVLKTLGIIIGGILVGAIWAAINILNVIIKVVGWLINMFIEIGERVVWFVNLVIQYFQFLYKFWSTIFKAIFTVAKIWFMAIGVIVATVVSMIMAVVQPIARFFAGIFQTAWDWVRGIWSGVSGWFGRQFDGLKGALSKVTGYITEPFSKAWDFIKDIPSKIVNGITNIGQLIRDKLGDWDIPGPLGKVRDVIPGFAKGVRNFRGGLAVVGERGPELVNLPKGSDVIPNDQVPRTFAQPATIQAAPSGPAQQTVINFNPKIEMGMYAGMPVEKRRIAEDLWREFTRMARANGVQLPSIGVITQ